MRAVNVETDGARELSPLRVASGRGSAYALLADLLDRGLVDETLLAAKASPILGPAIGSYEDLDEAAADHQHVFGFCVHPFRGAFLDPEGTAGGASAQGLHDAFRAVGYEPGTGPNEAEHLSTLLRALAFLSAAEADAIEDAAAPTTERLRALSAGFLDRHVLSWLPAFASSARRVGRAFPTALVDQIEDLALFHRSALGNIQIASVAVKEAFSLPELPSLLEDESTGLGDIARMLTTPSLAGIFVSREDIARLARHVRVPRGFGERAVLLNNLLRSAVQYDALDAVLEGLDGLYGDWLKELGEERYVTVAGLLPLLVPWRQRAEHVRGLLGHVRQHAGGQ